MNPSTAPLTSNYEQDTVMRNAVPDIEYLGMNVKLRIRSLHQAPWLHAGCGLIRREGL